jgi:nucleoside-diphosphate-sugar epimerase
MLPEYFSTEAHLDDVMTEPSAALVEMMGRIRGDIMVLGIGGKMGYTLGRQAVRAIELAKTGRRVLGVSRFSASSQRTKIESAGIETLACDLLDPDAIDELPDVPNIIFMAGRKFGTGGSEHLTWAMNSVVPSLVARRFAGARIVVFSTGCVYPLVRLADGGCSESHPVGPVGEYSMSCLGRERVFEYYSRKSGTPMSIARLNYAIDLRYGVLHDIASSIHQTGTVDLSVPAFNAIWQGDATDQILRMLEYCESPPSILNITGPEQVSTRQVARDFARAFGRDVDIPNSEGGIALLSDSSRAARVFGLPRVPMESLIRWTTEWIARGGASLGKPTHFEVNDGKF